MEKKETTLGAITPSREETILRHYEGDPKNKILRHALSRHAVSSVLYEPASIPGVTMSYSLELETMAPMNQKASGRCWIYSGLGFVREMIGRKLGIKTLELSTNFTALYDKIEKANYALESALYYAPREKDDRELKWFLANPIGDGGQWDMLVNLIDKYGLVPMDVFPDTYQSSNTRETDWVVTSYIRNFAAKAHALVHEGKEKEARELKEETMEKIYHLFLNAFGVPPKSFDFEYKDAKGKRHVERGLTPLSFKEKYVGDELDSYVSLINSPTEDKPYLRSYTIDRLGNVIEGKIVTHFNVTMERMKELILKQLKDGEPVWFGSDVSFYRDRNSYAWDDNAIDYEGSFGLSVEMDKAAMLDFSASAMNHAMLIVGCDLVENEPRKWKIENSWGTDNGQQGYYSMSASWFDKFVYQAVVHKKYLTAEELKAYRAEPILLKPWDPMGTLAD